MGILRGGAAALALALLAACAAPLVEMNRPLAMDAEGRPDFDANYGLAPYVGRLVQGQAPSDPAGSDILLFVTISGGGKRSAAFGHGALRGLGAIPLHPPDGRRLSLLNALDYIAGVSGGSFAAAHYGLYRERSFATFREQFLRADLDAAIWGIYLLPWHWGWIADPFTGTNDYMARVYDRLMFHGATFADLARIGRPIVSINATDIANGTTFAMLGTNFGLLCSDLNSFPIARAVAASNGFPGLFSPVTLTSYAERCAGQRPTLAAEAASTTPEPEDVAARRRQLARLHEIYADPAQTRYVHLMDGGIADNLALRGLLNFFIVAEGEAELFPRIALATRRLLVLSVDGEAPPPRELGQRRAVGGLLTVLSAASGTQIDRYNFETLSLARAQLAHLGQRIAAIRCAAGPVINGHRCDDVRAELVHVALSDIADPGLRERLGAIATGLTIPEADADALVAHGEALVRDHPTIRAIAAEADFPLSWPPVVGGAAQSARMPRDRTTSPHRAVSSRR